jgi:hypothetical protein
MSREVLDVQDWMHDTLISFRFDLQMPIIKLLNDTADFDDIYDEIEEYLTASLSLFDNFLQYRRLGGRGIINDGLLFSYLRQIINYRNTVLDYIDNANLPRAFIVLDKKQKTIFEKIKKGIDGKQQDPPLTKCKPVDKFDDDMFRETGNMGIAVGGKTGKRKRHLRNKHKNKTKKRAAKKKFRS